VGKHGPVSASTRIVVIGGGIVGASVAYHLARRGVSVVIVAADHAGAATDAGAGIICPWADQADDAGYRLAAEGARYYPELLAMLAGDGQADTGYAKVGALCVADDAGALQAGAARLRSRLAATPEIGEVAVLEPGGPTRMFPPLAGGLAGVWIAGGARVDGRAIRDSLLRAAAGRGARRIRSAAWLDLAAGRVTGVRAGTDRIGADAVVVAAGAWTAQVCAGVGWPLPIGPQRGQIVHARLPDADTAGWPVVLPAGDPYLLGFPAGRVVLGATREDVGFEHAATLGGVGGLLAAGLQLAPGLARATLLETRIGFRPATADGRPLLGWLAEGLLVAAGHGPEGLTAGPWTGRAAAALALGEAPGTDVAPFDPARFSPGLPPSR
jgi:glycine/D-amino acid oxidase-like deaminating enzyme